MPASTQKKRSPGPLLALAVLIGIATPVRSEVINVSFDEPTLDRWMYPFSANPGFQTFASIFGAITDQEVGFDPGFDNRDGQMLIGFDTSTVVPAGLGAGSYTITATSVFLTVKTDEAFGYDPTLDLWASWLASGDPAFVADRDPGRAVELFGAGFRDGWSASTFPEDGPFCAACSCFPPSVCKSLRNVYPIDFDLACASGDVSNNVDEQTDPVPWAIATNAALNQGQLVPIDTELTFAVNVADPCIQAYLQAALDVGMLDFVVTSIFLAVPQQEGGFPKIYTKEDSLVQLGIVSAARLTMTVEVIDCPTDVNGDGVVNVLDLIDLLLCFGQPAVPGCEPQDVNGDGAVNVLDLIDLLLDFGQACP